MFKYTQGIGGGSGGGVDYCLWDVRDGTIVSSYTNQVSKLYMTPIYIRGKSANYLLVKVKKEPIPSHTVIQNGTQKIPPKAESGAIHIASALKALLAKKAISSKHIISVMSGMHEKGKSVVEKIDEIIREANLDGVGKV